MVITNKVGDTVFSVEFSKSINPEVVTAIMLCVEMDTIFGLTEDDACYIFLPHELTATWFKKNKEGYTEKLQKTFGSKQAFGNFIASAIHIFSLFMSPKLAVAYVTSVTINNDEYIKRIQSSTLPESGEPRGSEENGADRV